MPIHLLRSCTITLGLIMSVIFFAVTGRQMAGEATEAVTRRARTPPDSLGGHVDP